MFKNNARAEEWLCLPLWRDGDMLLYVCPLSLWVSVCECPIHFGPAFYSAGGQARDFDPMLG